MLRNNITQYVKNITNIHSDMSCVIIGSGPSLSKSYSFLKYAVENHFLLLGLNDTLLDKHFVLDYHFLGDLTAFSKNNISKNKLLNSRVNKKKIWYGSSVKAMSNTRREKRRYNQVLSRNTIRFLQNPNKKENPWLILNRINNKGGLFRELRPDKSLQHSTVFLVVEFALLMGFKKIYLVGCDCTDVNIYRPNERMNYFDYHSSNSKLLKGWNLMSDFIKDYFPTVEIYSVNPVGLCNLIPEDLNIKNIYENKEAEIIIDNS